VGRNLLHNRYATPRRADRPGVGAAGAAAASREARDGSAECRPPTDHQRDPVARANRSAVARPAGAIWAVVNGVQPVLALADRRGLGSSLCRRPTAGGRSRGSGLGYPVCRWQRDPGAPARRWCKGGAPETEALGRSQGGFSTKVVAARSFAPPCGTPMTKELPTRKEPKRTKSSRDMPTPFAET
jgi:hypothetical protein